MKLLNVVNYCLKYLGETRVSSVDTRHPTVNDVVLETESQINTLLSKGWWFNERTQTYYPDVQGKIAAPVDAIMVSSSELDVDIVDGYFWDIANDTNIFSGPLTITVRYNYTFERLPEVAAEYIKQEVAIILYTQEYGVENTVQVLVNMRDTAWMYLQREELNKRKYNSLSNPAVFRFVSALRGTNGYC